MQLPIEIFETVIDQARDNSASLRNLSLTCATFLPRSRYHLFSSIIIQGMNRMGSCGDFFDSHPWLLPLIYKVTVSTKIRQDYPSRNIRVLDRVPVNLLTRLPNVRAWSMELVTAGWQASLSLHRSMLAMYRTYSSRIQSLNLSGIRFRSFLDFTGLVAAFTSIRSLICSNLKIESWPEEEFNLSFYMGRGGRLSRRPQLSTFTIRPGVDIRVQEYILARYGTTLSSLSLNACELVYSQHFDRLEESVKRLSRLSSLTLMFCEWDDDERKSVQIRDFPDDIRSATRFLEHVRRTSLTEVRVEFEVDPIASLGSRLSGPEAPLEACGLLEKALLTFPNSRITVSDGKTYWRAGRPTLWSPVIRHAFPKMDEKGLLHLNFMHTGAGSLRRLGHEHDVTSLVTSRNSRWIVTASRDDTIIVWDTSSHAVVHEWLACQGGIYALALSPDNRQLVSAGGLAAIVWAIRHDGVQKVAELGGQTGTVRACAWSPDGALIALASKDKTVRVWDGRTFQQRDLFLDQEEDLYALQFSPDSRYLAWISGFDSDCCIWRPLVGEEPKRLPSHPDYPDVEALAFSFNPESSLIATAHGDYNCKPDSSVVQIWDVATGETLDVLDGTMDRRMTGVSFSRDGRFLLSESDGGFVKVWDAESWEELANFEDDDANEPGADSASPWDSDAETGDLPVLSGTMLGEVDPSWIAIACFSPDGKFIATGTGMGLVRLWRMRMDGYVSCVATFREHHECVKRIAFSPNGEFLVSGDWDGIVHIRRISHFI